MESVIFAGSFRSNAFLADGENLSPLLSFNGKMRVSLDKRVSCCPFTPVMRAMEQAVSKVFSDTGFNVKVNFGGVAFLSNKLKGFFDE